MTAVPKNDPAASGPIDNFGLFQTVIVSFVFRADTLKLKHSFHVGLFVDLHTVEKTTRPSYSNCTIGSDVPFSFLPRRLEQLNSVIRKKNPASPCSSMLLPKSTWLDGKYKSCCRETADTLGGSLGEGSILAFDCCPLFEFKFKREEGEGGRDEGDKLGAES